MRFAIRINSKGRRTCLTEYRRPWKSLFGNDSAFLSTDRMLGQQAAALMTAHSGRLAATPLAAHSGQRTASLSATHSGQRAAAGRLAAALSAAYSSLWAVAHSGQWAAALLAAYSGL